MGFAMFESDFSNATVCITGGTGSFGSTMVRRLLSTGVGEIRVFSRDENKQDNLRNELQDARVQFIIGDTREKASARRAINGSDFVFHAAALKQVPSCEFFPHEAVLTNIVGSKNVIELAIESGVKSIVCLSTDKAVYPINAMGMSKALMERTAQAYAREIGNSGTKISITRYGNVMMSRGSVIPKFIQQLKHSQKVTITNGEMTRFMMSLESSVGLVEYALKNANTGDLFVQKAPACTVSDLVQALILIFSGGKIPEIEIIGTRHGEKLYETLLGTEEMARSIDEGGYFRVPLDTRSLNYATFFDQGKQIEGETHAYTSHNTSRLSIPEICELLLALDEMSSHLPGDAK